MSFKYRFILSFVLLEIFFIILIVSVNFKAISDSSQKLITDKIESNISLMKQLLKVPLSIYDIATLDDLVQNSKNLNYVNSIAIVDAKENVISKAFPFQYDSLQNLLEKKQNKEISIDNEIYKVRYEKLFEEDTLLGGVLLVFDVSENALFIKKNRQNTIILVLVEILISTVLSYIIGSKLTHMLERLAEVATHIGEDKAIEVPYLDKKDEIGTLSNSMHQMHSDLSERTSKLKELAIELNKQRLDLIEANKSKDDFLANMSHELKTPLNSINVISSVMMKNKQQKLDEEQVKNLSIINSCGNDLLFLINDVLDISKLEAGEISLNYAELNFKELIHSIVGMIQPQTSQKGLKLLLKMDENIAFIYSDEQRIKQIIKNLLSNALKFTSSGAIRIIVSKEDDNVKIEVSDDGIGIAQDKLEHIFDRFKQADGSTTRKFGGTGLGLAISKELTQLLEGSLEVKSEVNVGTTFTITLPINSDKVKSIKEVQPQTVSQGVQGQDILILNNNPMLMMSFIISLKKEFNVMQVTSLIDLVENIQQNIYRYIIVDISAVDMEEFKKVIEKLNVAFVFLYDETIDESIEKSARLVFQKPLQIDAIIEKIKENG